MKKELCELNDYNEILSILDKISIFGGLTRKQLSIIFEDLKKIYVNEGEYIFKQGGSPDNIYIIRSGSIKIREEFEGKEPYDIITFSTGECFGETELIGIFPYIASAIAFEKSELIVFSRKTLRKLYKTELPIFSSIILNVARESCRRLAQTNMRVFEFERTNHRK